MDKNLTDFIVLHKTGKSPLYVQLYEEIVDKIKHKTLSPGYKLPPVRLLAREMAINPGTVVSAYRELEKNGYIFTRRGSGSYVAERIVPAESEGQEVPDIAAELADDVQTDCGQDDVINMSSVSLNPDIISLEVLQKAIDDILKRDRGYAFTYQDSRGYMPLRQSIAAYSISWRGRF